MTEPISSRKKIRVSVRDIAARAGTSHTAVSLALRDDPRITLATRNRIQRAARELGYRPDAVVSSLMARLRTLRTHKVRATLGFITAWPTRLGWSEASNHRRFFVGARRQAESLGYALDEFWLTEPGMNGKRMTEILRTRGVHGLILHSLPAMGGQLDLEWRHFAFVTKGLTVSHPSAHRVVSSHYEDMRLVLSEMDQRLYRRVGLVLDEKMNIRVDRAWLAAFLLHQQGLPEADQVPALVTTLAEEEASFRSWYAKHRPDAILFCDLRVVQWLENVRVRVPRNVGLVHLDWSRDVSPLAGLDSNPDALGVAATDLLVGQLHANEFGIPVREKIVAVRGRWASGSSVRPR